MLVKVNDNRIINLDKIFEIVKDDSNLMLYLYFFDIRVSVKFEDESMLDNAYNKIFTSYNCGKLVCDISEYTK